MEAPLGDILAAYRDLPRLTALDALAALDVAILPHTTEEGATAIIRQLQHAAGLDFEDGALYDNRGRRVSRGYDDFMAWLSGHGIAAAA